MIKAGDYTLSSKTARKEIHGTNRETRAYNKGRVAAWGSGTVEWMIRLVQQTGIVLGVMACVSGGAICAVKLAEKVKRFPGRKKDEEKK